MSMCYATFWCTVQCTAMLHMSTAHVLAAHALIMHGHIMHAHAMHAQAMRCVFNVRINSDLPAVAVGQKVI
jgi:hypothetical protein